MKDVREAIREKAKGLGFQAVGFARAGAEATDGANLAAFLKDGRHGDMDWLAANAARRADPRVLWPEARTIVSVGLNYAPSDDPLGALARPREGAVSVYARGGDYHHLLKKRLKRLARWVAETHGGGVKVFVDTAPVMEKPAAMRAGIGWQGKHTNLVSRAHGSWLFLGEMLTTLDLPPDRPPDSPEADHCGTCDACLRACPTDALPAPYRMDARRCISYLTIEHKGDIDPALKSLMGNRIYGCDDCLAVCPWNKFATPTKEPVLLPRAELAAPRLADLAALDDAAFRALFAGSPIKRTGRDRFVRNVMIAVGNSGGNSGEASLLAVARARLDDSSPLVREAARWAVERLE